MHVCVCGCAFYVIGCVRSENSVQIISKANICCSSSNEETSSGPLATPSLQNAWVAAKRLFCARCYVVVTRYSSCRLKRDLDLSFSRRICENSSDLKPQPRPRRQPPATTATPPFDTVQLIPVLCLAAASDEQPRGGWKSLPERVLLPGKCGSGPKSKAN